MAIKLEDKPNVNAPSPTYPYGDIRDNPGDGTGTPLNEFVHQDFHQFFASILSIGESIGGMTINGLRDDDVNGFQYLQAFNVAARLACRSLFKYVAEAICGGGVLPTAPYILAGLANHSPIIDPGYIYFQGDLYVCSGYVPAISLTAQFNKTAEGVLTITDSSTPGLFNYGDLLRMQNYQNPDQIITKKINIGDWNMYSSGGGSGTTGKSVAHGLDFTKILSVEAFILDDSGATLLRPIDWSSAGYVQILTTNVSLGAFASGSFDNTSYNLTPFNRGYIIIKYLL